MDGEEGVDMKKYNELNAVAQQLIDCAINAAINAYSHKEHKEYKMMNRYIGEKDAYIHAAAIADDAEAPKYGETYGIYCDRFMETKGCAMFMKAA